MWGVLSFETGDIDFRIGGEWIGLDGEKSKIMMICTIHTFEAMFWQMDGEEGKEEDHDEKIR
jgi:hypothetical protein